MFQIYGFNGMEKDDEVKGAGNSYDFGARMLDTRLGRWLSIDELSSKYSSFSGYNYCFNNPIVLTDPDGRDIVQGKELKDDNFMMCVFNVLQETSVFKKLNKKLNVIMDY